MFKTVSEGEEALHQLHQLTELKGLTHLSAKMMDFCSLFETEVVKYKSTICTTYTTLETFFRK